MNFLFEPDTRKKKLDQIFLQQNVTLFVKKKFGLKKNSALKKIRIIIFNMAFLFFYFFKKRSVQIA
jgi:hypothetical protein